MSKRERLFWFLLSFLLFLSHFTIPDRVKAVSRETEMYLNIFHEALKFIRMDYVEEVKEADLFKGAIRGVLSSLGDPHSRFLDEDEFKEHKEETRGSYGGIGIEVTYRNGSILVISPIDGTPAKKAGILPGDRIVEIDGKQTRKMTIPDAIKIMRGKIGSSVKIKIKRKGHDELLDFSFVRKLIQIHYIKSEYISKQKIGYIRLTQFMGFENTLEEFQKTLHSLLKKGARSFIIDLRMNPGGLLQMATEISDLFLPEGKVIVSVRGRGGKLIQVSKSSSGDKTLEKIPLLVLIDKGSASASEIFAGAIKDNKRGLILGEKSFGKGSVQNIYSLPHDTGLALTIQKYYTPSEKSIHGIGIQPDVVVESLKPRDFEKKALIKLFKSSFIETFVKKHPDGYNRKNRQRFLKELNRMSIHLSREIALSLLKKEYNLNHETVFDLEFDPQLRKAIQILGKKK